MRLPKRIIRSRKNQAVQDAREYAKQWNLQQVKRCLEKASLYGPVTQMQLHLIRQILGTYKFDELDLTNVKIKPEAGLCDRK